MKIAITLSETEDINSEDDDKLSKMKRRKLASKTIKMKDSTISSVISPLPEPPVNTPGTLFYS